MTENTQQLQNGHTALPVPPGIKNTPLIPAVQTGQPTLTSIKPPDTGMSISNKTTEFQWKFSEETHQYVREYIRQADQKAAFFFAGATALIAFLYKAELVQQWVKTPTEWVFVDMLSFFATLGLFISVLMCLLTVFPRLKGSKRGLVFFSAVAEFESGKDYAANVLQQEINDLIEAKLCHVHDLSKICERKYCILKIGQLFGAIGVLAMVILLLAT